MTLFKKKTCREIYKNLYRKIRQERFADLWNKGDIATIATELKATVNNETTTVYLDIDGKPVDTDTILKNCDDKGLVQMFVRAIEKFMLNPESSLETARATAAANVQARTQQRVNELKKNAAIKAVKYEPSTNNHKIFSQTPLSANEVKQNAEALAYAASKGATPTEAVSAVNKANGETATNSRGNVWSAVLTEPDTYLVKLVEKGTRGGRKSKTRRNRK